MKKAIRQPKIVFHKADYKQGFLSGEQNASLGSGFLQPSRGILVTLKESPAEWMDKYETQMACLSKQYLMA